MEKKNKKKRNKWRKLITSIVTIIMALISLFGGGNAANADTGVDTSNYQGCITSSRAAQAKSSGVNFAFQKITEGRTYTDPQAHCSMAGLASAGIRLGAYHFARPENNSADAEAQAFINQTRQYIGKGVIPVLDWEPPASQRGNTLWAKRWLDLVASAWGTKPLIYMSASVIKAGNWSAVANADYGLWVAGYPHGYAADSLRNPGSVPYSVAPWKFAAAWQYSSSGNVPGVGSKVDVNFFYGDAVTWAKYAKSPLPSGNEIKPQAPAPSTTPTGDANMLATAVIRGDYGNNPQRKAILGSRYNEVMAIVNQRLGGSKTATNSVGYCVVVKPGDSLSAIAARTGRTPYTKWTGYRSGNPAVIYVGERVCYGGGSSTASSGRVHMVRSGETLSGIFGSSWKLVAARNGIINPNLIYPGQKLKY